MMELVFSESARGSLKEAQHYGEGIHGGCIGILFRREDGKRPTRAQIKAARREAEAKARLDWENAVPMGGNSADVFGGNLGLSTGSIAGEQRALPLETIRRRMQAGEGVRIWYSDQPDELCGFYWFLSRLDQWELDAPVTAAKLPDWEQSGGWGGIPPGKWQHLASLQAVVPKPFIRECASRWRVLVKENAPLRVVRDGQPVSAPETYYDGYLVREIEAAEHEFREAAVIAEVLIKYRLGISDDWVASRIERMVQDGKLEVVSEAPEGEPAYRRGLRKVWGGVLNDEANEEEY